MGTSCCSQPKCPWSCLFWGCSVVSTSPPRALLQVPGGASAGHAKTPGLQPPSRTPSSSAGGCDSPGISAYGRGKWEVERLYFNTPLWVGDLEKQLGEQECEVQPPPLQAWLPCRRAQGDLYKAMEEASGGAGPPAPGLRLGGTLLWAPRVPEHHCPGLQRGWEMDRGINPLRLARMRRSRAHRDAAGWRQAGASGRRGMERVCPGTGEVLPAATIVVIEYILAMLWYSRCSVFVSTADALCSWVEGEIKLLPPLFLMCPIGNNLNNLKLTGTCSLQSLK